MIFEYVGMVMILLLAIGLVYFSYDTLKRMKDLDTK